jgi:hypothetical protein
MVEEVCLFKSVLRLNETAYYILINFLYANPFFFKKKKLCLCELILLVYLKITVSPPPLLPPPQVCGGGEEKREGPLTFVKGGTSPPPPLFPLERGPVRGDSDDKSTNLINEKVQKTSMKVEVTD